MWIYSILFWSSTLWWINFRISFILIFVIVGYKLRITVETDILLTISLQNPQLKCIDIVCVVFLFISVGVNTVWERCHEHPHYWDIRTINTLTRERIMKVKYGTESGTRQCSFFFYFSPNAYTMSVVRVYECFRMKITHLEYWMNSVLSFFIYRFLEIGTRVVSPYWSNLDSYFVVFFFSFCSILSYCFGT